MKPRHPIAGLCRHPITVPAAEARASLLLVAAILAAASLATIALVVIAK